MFKNLSFIAALLMMSTSIACPRQEPGDLTGVRWIRSHEEDRQGVRIYRQQNFPFPASRGRSGMELHKDGSGFYGEIAPGDGVIWQPARWNLHPDSLLEIMVKPKGSPGVSRYTFKLITVETGKLSLVFIKQEEVPAGN